MKIAIVHEMLIKLWWAEKVVEKMLEMFPDADFFTLIYDEEKTGKIFSKNKINKQVFKLPSQKLYNITKKQRFCLPLMARSVEQLDLSTYDVVLCSSSGFSHGAITKPDTKFIVYYHSPARYMWDWTNEYKRDIWFQSWIKSYILNKLFLKLRIWDVIASNRVDIVLANAKNTAKRITKYYRRESQILYPPVEVNRFQKKLSTHSTPFFKDQNYYIIISALTEFKKIDIAISAFNKMPDKNLLIIWAWDAENKLKNLVSNDNIIFSGPQYWDDLVYLVQNSLGLIFPWEEDFWIVPIEVMAAGKPVFAYHAGGLLETVIKWKTGEFFNENNWDDFIENFIEFDAKNKKGYYSSESCKKQAELFSDKNFETELLKIIKKTDA